MPKHFFPASLRDTDRVGNVGVSEIEKGRPSHTSSVGVSRTFDFSEVLDADLLGLCVYRPVVLFVSGEAFAGAVTPVRIIGAVSLMS